MEVQYIRLLPGCQCWVGQSMGRSDMMNYGSYAPAMESWIKYSDLSAMRRI